MFDMKGMGSDNFAQKMMDRMFRKVDDACWDLTTGRIGIVTKDGIVSCDGEGDDASITINIMEQFGMAIPAFAQSTPPEALKVGDVIYGARGIMGWIVEKKEKSFDLLKTDGTRSRWSPPKTQMIGFDGGVMVLRSLMNMLPGGQGGLQGFSSMLMPLMMMGGDMDDIGGMLPMLLMSQTGITNPDGSTAPNPLGGNFAQMLPTMMMMKMLKGGNSNAATKGSGNFFSQPRS